MPIRPFLAGQAFDPETITKMSAAYERVCAALGIKFVDDAATRLVAQVSSPLLSARLSLPVGRVQLPHSNGLSTSTAQAKFSFLRVVHVIKPAPKSSYLGRQSGALRR